jgi:hypothetical protein
MNQSINSSKLVSSLSTINFHQTEFRRSHETLLHDHGGNWIADSQQHREPQSIATDSVKRLLKRKTG